MSNNARLPLAEARAKAESLLIMLKPVAKRAEIAGSIRRGKADVGDLEIVAQTTLQLADPLDSLLADLERRGVITPELRADGKPRAWSSRYRAAYFDGMRLDLFIVRPDRDWGVTMLIRTGPGDANEYLVTRRTSSHAPGATPAHLAFRDGALWRLPYRHDFKLDRLLPGSVRIEAPEEADVYAALGMPYVPPEERTVETYQRVRGTVSRRSWFLCIPSRCGLRPGGSTAVTRMRSTSRSAGRKTDAARRSARHSLLPAAW